MKIKKVFQITFGADFCSVTFGTEQEAVNADPDELFKSVKILTDRDIKMAMKQDPFIKKLITKATTVSTTADDEAAELLRNL